MGYREISSEAQVSKKIINHIYIRYSMYLYILIQFKAETEFC